jgi:hypothetical protein
VIIDSQGHARLAAKLTGWKIDIKSETDARAAGVYPAEEALNEEDEKYPLQFIFLRLRLLFQLSLLVAIQ